VLCDPDDNCGDMWGHIMKRVTAFAGLVVAMAASANAQTEGKQVLACVEQDSAGFADSPGGYKNTRFNVQKYAVSVNGNTLSANINGRNRTFSCSQPYDAHVLLCTSGFSTFAINLKSLNFVRSQNFGPLDDETTSGRDSLSVTYGSCQKF
jgi:hypothetical protein